MQYFPQLALRCNVRENTMFDNTKVYTFIRESLSNDSFVNQSITKTFLPEVFNSSQNLVAQTTWWLLHPLAK